jgi:hypothetical protein
MVRFLPVGSAWWPAFVPADGSNVGACQPGGGSRGAGGQALGEVGQRREQPCGVPERVRVDQVRVGLADVRADGVSAAERGERAGPGDRVAVRVGEPRGGVRGGR